MVSQTVRTFAEFLVADHLADGPLTTAQIAARAGSDPGTTARLLRTGIVYGLVEVDADDQFYGTELLDTLRSNESRSLRGMALGATNTSHWAPWAALPYGVRVGTSQVSQTLGMPAFDFLVQNPEQAGEFTAYMQSVTSLWALDLAQSIDTRGVGLAVDIGGANGALLRELLRADWDDDDCVRILSSCRDAMRPGARVAIIEMVVGEGNDPGVAAVMDLTMLAVTEGKERTVVEYDRLPGKAGLRRTSFWSDGSPQGVIEATAM